MPENATSVATAEESGASRLDSILSSDLHSSSPDSGQPAEAQAAEPTDANQEQAAADVEFDESSILPLEQETDFADEDYARAAKHYSKQFKMQFNLQDAGQRSILRELMSRGRTIANMRSTQSTEEADGAQGEEIADSAEEQPQLETPEAVAKFLDATEAYAGKMVRPEVAQRVAKNFISAVFGPDQAAKISPEGASRFTQSMYSMGLLMLNDALPQIIPQLVESRVNEMFPMLSEMHSANLETSAIKQLAKLSDAKSGQARYPGIEKLIADGTFEAVYNENPELRGGQFFDVNTGRPLSPLDNKKRELHVVYQMARGRSVNPALLQQVADTAASKATNRARTAGSTRLAAGESKGAFQQPDAAQDFLQNLVRGDDASARWEQEVAKSRPRRA